MPNATNASTQADISLDSLVASVADEFRERQSRGEKPDIEEYAARHPHAADLLRKVLATFQLLDVSLSGGGNGTAEEALSGTLGDFRLLREVGRGGMGIVYEAEQISLARRVAVKVLPFAATLDPRHLQRFHNEARAAASLRHEHIVPVYAVGQERGVHFFAMQFVDGQTLADLIAEQRGDKSSNPTVSSPSQTPAAETVAGKSTEPAPRKEADYRRIAEWGIQAAEALEHAHSLGIVHRDIKPGNLMIDARGQLWIADFGLARRAADSDLTMTGDVLGTLRYMSPEQALAKHDLVDHHSDVYSLGATLYEMLTLRHAVGGKNKEEILQEIIHTDAMPLRDWDRRIPVDLETIVLKALAKEPEGRYSTAKELAEDLRRYLSHEPIRARRPTLRQKVARWGRRNRPAVIAATIAAFVVTAILGGAAGLWYQQKQDRIAREQDKFQTRQTRVIADASRLLDEADYQLKMIGAKLADPIKVCELLSNIDGWRNDLAKARAAWQHGNDLVASNQDVATKELTERLRIMEEELKADEADWNLAKNLDDIRLEAATLVTGGWNPGHAAPRYEKLFTTMGLDWKKSKPAEITPTIRQAKLRYVLVAALDDWCRPVNKTESLLPLLETARLTDPHPVRDQVRDPERRGNQDSLAELARQIDVSQQSPQNLRLLSSLLKKEDRASLLRAALVYNPQDFWLHFELGYAVQNPDQQIGCFQTCLALRPTSAVAHNNLGNALRNKKDFDVAIREFCKAIELNPNLAEAHYNLGLALRDKKDLDGSIREFRKAIELDLKRADAHNNLGAALLDKQDLDGAIREFRKAIELDRKHADAHNNLGNALRDKQDLDGAIREYRKAIDLAPELADVHYNLGTALRAIKDLGSAIREFRKAIELDPKFAKAHNNLGNALDDMKDLDGAIREYRKAIELDPKEAAAHYNLGAALRNKQDLDGAIREFRKAIEVDPELAMAHFSLGGVLYLKKDVDGAMSEFQKAIELNPKYAAAHFNLGLCLTTTGQFSKALQHLRRAYELDMTTQPLAESCERFVKLDQEVPAVLKGDVQPKSLQGWLAYVDVCDLKKDDASAATIWKRKFHDVSTIAGNLAPDKREHTYEVILQAGKAYVIQLESTAFDTLLRLHDAEGNKLAENDDIAPGIILNSRLIFNPKADGSYRIVASAFNNGGVGSYTLTIREFVK